MSEWDGVGTRCWGQCDMGRPCRSREGVGKPLSGGKEELGGTGSPLQGPGGQGVV
jgi:hypothetical protein